MDKDNHIIIAPPPPSDPATATSEADTVPPQSPGNKPLAFTIDFGGGKSIDTHRHQTLVEKYQKRHRRGQSLSKLDTATPSPSSSTAQPRTKHPLTGNLPRKSSFQSEGYFSSDDVKSERITKGATNQPRTTIRRCDLTLPLKSALTEKMSRSFPNAAALFDANDDLKDTSSPELLDFVSPFSPLATTSSPTTTTTTSSLSPPRGAAATKNDNNNSDSSINNNNKTISKVLRRQFSSPEYEAVRPPPTITTTPSPNRITTINNDDDDNIFIDGTEFDFDAAAKSDDDDDTVSDAGTYTLDADNYSEEQKARMSIDKDFKIERGVSMLRKAEEYVKTLNAPCGNEEVAIKYVESITPPPPHYNKQQFLHRNNNHNNSTKMLSPILSPTQNLSITDDGSPVVKNEDEKHLNNGVISNSNETLNKTFTKIMFPSPKAKNGTGLEQLVDQGSVISVTSSGAFRSKQDKDKLNRRKLSLTKSEVHVEAYVNDKIDLAAELVQKMAQQQPKLTANLINVQSIPHDRKDQNGTSLVEGVVNGNLIVGKIQNLPPLSPSKIPSPIHTMSPSRPRSRNSGNVMISGSLNQVDLLLSDSSLETESYLKPTQNFINSLQQRLCLDNNSDEQDYDKYQLQQQQQLNNSPHNLLSKQRATHTRHNSLDDRNIKISNKLEHFQNKNLQQQSIDQTYLMLNQYGNSNNNKIIHKIQNSPNNSPIRRSSSFTTKHQNNNNNNTPTKNTNVLQKESNTQIRNSPRNTTTTTIQRSASTANIKPTGFNDLTRLRRSSISNHKKIDRNQFGDTESSSEEDLYDKAAGNKKKDLSNLTNTRYNRAFSLRKGRLDDHNVPKCPNTPEMRRKFQPDYHGGPAARTERAISMDRKPVVERGGRTTNDTMTAQSRYLLNSNRTKGGTTMLPNKVEPISSKNVPKVVVSTRTTSSSTTPSKSAGFSRTDSGRFSMKASKPPVVGGQKSSKQHQRGGSDGSGKKSGGRSNSSLSSREVEFQNWKRRKSYDPMKAAAEGKKKEIAKRQNCMTQSYTEANNQNQDCDSSPSHSSSVHRSQSFHGTAALEQLISSEEDDDLTLSADEGFSPPTPSPCELSPVRASLRNAWREHVLH